MRTFLFSFYVLRFTNDYRTIHLLKITHEKDLRSRRRANPRRSTHRLTLDAIAKLIQQLRPLHFTRQHRD